jgi:hypothetical protein
MQRADSPLHLEIGVVAHHRLPLLRSIGSAGNAAADAHRN